MGSSILSLFWYMRETQKYTQAETTNKYNKNQNQAKIYVQPIIMAAQGRTTAQGAVMLTNPAKVAFKVIGRFQSCKNNRCDNNIKLARFHSLKLRKIRY